MDSPIDDQSQRGPSLAFLPTGPWDDFHLFHVSESSRSARGRPLGALFLTLLLRPHGSTNLTPLASAWIGFGLTVMAIMALLEGTVWSAVTRPILANWPPTMQAVVGVAAFMVAFSLVWVVDSSLLMYQRRLRPKQPGWTPGLGVGDPADPPRADLQVRPATLRPHRFDIDWAFGLGLGIRLLIVGSFLGITAPFLNQVIRETEVTQHIQRKIATFQADEVGKKKNPLEAEKERLNTEILAAEKSLGALQTKLKTDHKETYERIRLFEEESARWQREADLELAGREGRKAGEGPRYREAIRKRDENKAVLSQAKTDLKDKAGSLLTQIETAEGTLASQRANLKTIAEQIAALDADLNLPPAEFVAKHGIPAPENTAGERIKALQEIQKQEGIPWHMSVETLTRAFLFGLFLALLAIKLFEPESLRLYYNEKLQDAWRGYWRGRFRQVPGFPLPRPDAGMSFPEFAERYAEYSTDEDRYWERHRQRVAQSYRTEELRAEQEAGIAEAQARSFHAAFERFAQMRRVQVELEGLRDEHVARLEHQQAEHDLQRRELERDLEERRVQSEKQAEAELARLTQEHDQRMRRARVALTEQILELRRRRRESTREMEQRRADAEAQQRRRELEEQRMRGELAIELRSLRKLKSQVLADAEKERTVRLTRLTDEIAQRRTQLQQRIDAEATQQRDAQTQRMAEISTAFARELSILAHQRQSLSEELARQRGQDTAQQIRMVHELMHSGEELRLREERVRAELDIERARLAAVAQGLSSAAMRKRAESEFALARQERADRIAAIDGEIERTGIAAGRVKAEIVAAEEGLAQAKAALDELERKRDKENRRPNQILSQINALQEEIEDITGRIARLQKETGQDYDGKAINSAEEARKEKRDSKKQLEAELASHASCQQATNNECEEARQRVTGLASVLDMRRAQLATLEQDLAHWNASRREWILAGSLARTEGPAGPAASSDRRNGSPAESPPG